MKRLHVELAVEYMNTDLQQADNSDIENIQGMCTINNISGIHTKY